MSTFGHSLLVHAADASKQVSNPMLCLQISPTLVCLGYLDLVKDMEVTSFVVMVPHGHGKQPPNNH